MTERSPHAQEAIEEGRLCENATCTLKLACARFYDPARKEHAFKTYDGQLFLYVNAIDHCFALRQQLEGTQENHREFQHKAKNFRRKTGKPTLWGR